MNDLEVKVEPRRIGIGVSLTLALLHAAGVLFFFHNRFWYAPDDGAYAHVADRINQGEILNRDIQDVHAGYINFANAFALQGFGRDLVSLRYPLVIMGLLQALLTWCVALPFGAFRALLASITITSLGAVQFLNPTAHWYVLFLLICAASLITLKSAPSRRRDLILGVLIGLIFCFRQLSGVLCAIALFTAILREPPPLPPAGKSKSLVKMFGVVMSLGIFFYLRKRVDLGTFLVFALIPMLLPTLIAWKSNWTNGDLLRRIGTIAVGFTIAGLPLLGYHLWHGSVGVWIDDTVVSAIGLTELDFINRFSFLGTRGDQAVLPIARLLVFSPQHVSDLANGIYWHAILLAAPLASLVVLWKVIEGKTMTSWLVMAPIFSLVSMHYQIPIYAYYTAGFVLVGLLLSPPFPKRATEAPVAGFFLLVNLCAIWYQAGQPVSRPLLSLLRGERINWVSAEQIDNASLLIDETSRQKYQRLLQAIELHSQQGDPILAMPVNPELYFLSNRKNPTRFFNSALGLQRETDLEATLALVRKQIPKVVVLHPDDKYVTANGLEVIGAIKQSYQQVATIEEFEIYIPIAPPEDAVR